MESELLAVGGHDNTVSLYLGFAMFASCWWRSDIYIYIFLHMHVYEYLVTFIYRHMTYVDMYRHIYIRIQCIYLFAICIYFCKQCIFILFAQIIQPDSGDISLRV